MRKMTEKKKELKKWAGTNAILSVTVLWHAGMLY